MKTDQANPEEKQIHTEERQNDTEVTEQQGETTETIVAELAIWKEKYIRVLADYQNLERRTSEEKEQIRKFSAEITIRQLLPAIDGLAIAAAHINNDGLTLSLKQFYSILENIGVKKIQTVGATFDPHSMECVEVTKGEESVVLEEVTPGYMLHDKVIQVAKVKVGKKI